MGAAPVPGGTYVAPEAVGDADGVGADAAAILTAWVDRLVPGDAHWPAASATPAIAYIAAMLDRVPSLRPGAQSAIARLRDGGFLALDVPARVQELRALEASPEHGPAFAAILELTLEAYYRDPAVEEVVRARTGFDTRRTMTGTRLPPFDEARLERVRALAPRYRHA